jgi:tetratricopeptide (TPR) repeat protein
VAEACTGVRRHVFANMRIPEPQYYPSPLEFTILILMVGELLAIGYLAKRYWERRGEAIPPTVAIVLWGVMVGTFATVLFIFYLATPEPVYIDDPFLRADTPMPVDPRLRLTLWGFFMWLLPMGYYINLFRHSFSSYAVDHIGPLSGAIEDPSEFADARRLALRGDVNGAVAKYRAYDHNKSEALFEAARLLKSEDRFDEAAAMFEEIMKNTPGNRRVWAEACYQLAKLHELGWKNHDEAKRLLRLLLQRAPETRYGELASTDLARLQTVEDILDDGDVPEPQAEADPFFNSEDVRVRLEAPTRRRARNVQNVEEDDDKAPPVDPFFAGTHLRRASEKLAEKAPGNGQAEEAAVKPAAKKPAAKAKAPVAAKPKAVAAVKKPAAAKPAAKKPAAKKKSAD